MKRLSFFFFLLLLFFFVSSCTGGGGGIIPLLPGKAALTNPLNGAVGQIKTLVLQWFSENATSYDLYFGTAANPPFKSGGISVPSYSSAGDNLSSGEIYYWKVNSINSAGTVVGDIWAFSTAFEKPDGPVIEVTDSHVTKNQTFQFSIKGYSLTQVQGIEINLQFDPTLISLPAGDLANAVTLSGPLAGGLKIVQSTGAGNMKIAVTLMGNSANIDNQTILTVQLKSLNSACITKIQSSASSKVINSQLEEVIVALFDPGIVSIGY